jgi:hypothetical protein
MPVFTMQQKRQQKETETEEMSAKNAADNCERVMAK